jgi:hypothetical protein
MLFKSYVSRSLLVLISFAFSFVGLRAFAQSNANVRVMAANVNGNTQSYQPFALRIFQGLKSDVVCIQEFNYNNNTPSDFRAMVDAAFGTDFVYYRETNSAYQIPNGIISRYPFAAAGEWTDTQVGNRGFAWAQIDLPGTNDLYVVSVHLLTSSATARATEANNLKALMQANFPANAWIVVAGDFNADSRTEGCITTFSGYLTDFPVPVDNNGDSDTSLNRNGPHDFVLPSLTFTNLETATLLPSHSFPNGLVFDSRVYTPLGDVPPVLFGDSSNAQHMAVMKDFLIPVIATSQTNPPAITAQPQSQAASPGSNVTFTVTATGASPLSYQWLFNETNAIGLNTNFYSISNVQFTNAGNYSVIVTNNFGSATSSVAVLTVSNFPPSIITQPQGQTVSIGQSATFSVVASGTAPLNFQWRLGGTNIFGANTNSYTVNSAQDTNVGDYTIVITNLAGSVTSSVAALTLLSSNSVVIAQWNFNSIAPDANVATGTTAPSVGSGAASLAGGTSATFATGDTVLDPVGTTDNSGWNITSYPAAGVSNRTAGVQFNVSTAGRQNIVVTWSQRASNTGSKYVRLQYSTNGITFTNFPTAVSMNAATVFESKTNSLAGFAGVNNNSNFAFRIVSEWEGSAANTANNNYVAANPGSTYGGGPSGGTLRFDMITISGTAIVTNSAPIPPVMSGMNFSDGQFQFTVTGTTGVSYIVQSSTNLGASNWISILTNAAPFTFTESNILSGPLRFYRVLTP